MIKKISILIFLSLFFSCGYKVSNTGTLPNNLKKIDVALFENKTGFSRLEYRLKNEFVSELTKVNLFGSKKAKNGVLNGEIIKLDISTASKGSFDDAYERRVSIVINLNIIDNRGKTIYVKKGLMENYVFEASLGDLSEFGVPESALEEVCNKLAKRGVSLITSNF